MAEDLIRYDILAQDALRGVVRKVLSEVARTGIPGEHHFFISFATKAPGVRISSRLLAQYPEEMTIVLQHQYWDLSVTEHAFEVGLSFNNVPERLLVPFTALKGFADPSVQFGLQFDIAVRSDTDKTDPAVVPAQPRTAAEAEAELAATPAPLPLPVEIQAEPARTEEFATDGETDDDADEALPVAAEVVSLDAFRKK